MRAPLVLVIVVAALLGHRVADAHARLERSSPASGAMLDHAPTEVVLAFNTDVERRFARFLLVLPTGEERKLAGPAGQGLAKELAIPLGALGPGMYRLRWSVVSRDGHRIDGTITFTVKER